ncbi:hypothetical protein FQR65_LT19883 [Abscondita terminalis]|nr:hypothetical protein FQR65_LT19883 [Abscondita terminalis]
MYSVDRIRLDPALARSELLASIANDENTAHTPNLPCKLRSRISFSENNRPDLGDCDVCAVRVRRYLQAPHTLLCQNIRDSSSTPITNSRTTQTVIVYELKRQWCRRDENGGEN